MMKPCKLILALYVALSLMVDGECTCTSRPTLRLRSGYRATAYLRPSVRVLQGLLNNKGGFRLTVDGYFGTGTYNAVRQWQRSRGLTVDGIVGRNTWASLCPGTNSLNNPNRPAPRGTGVRWNPIMQFILARLKEKFPGKFSCSTYISSSGSSDHPGNAADCFPGRAGVCVTGQDRADGYQLAEWLRQNAKPLKIKYVIWQNRIWSVRHASRGWRWQGKSGCTFAHYDHVHISSL